MIIRRFAGVLTACSLLLGLSVGGCVNTSAWATDKNKLFPVSHWRLEEFASSSESPAVLPTERITLRLDAPDIGAGTTGCNRYKGQFRFSRGNSVDVAVRSVTRKRCSPEQDAQENTYLTRLAATQEYLLDRNRNQLILLNQQGQPLLLFNRD